MSKSLKTSVNRLSRAVAIGVDIGGTNISAGLVTPTGKLLHYKTIPSKALQGGPAVINRVKRLLKQIITKRTTLIGIGVGCPGSINYEKGLSQAMTPHIPKWRGLQIKKQLESVNRLSRQAFKIPVFVDNDVNVMALGEKYWGAGKGVDNIVCLTLGTGIGGAIILDGKLYRGPHYYAGEIGHMKIGLNGPRCDCGAKGCLESFASGTGIVRQIGRALSLPPLARLPPQRGEARPKGGAPTSPCRGGTPWPPLDKITAKMVFEAAKKNDYLARQVVNQAIHYLGRAIASVINMIDPELVILGGRIAQEGEYLLRPLRRVVKANVMPLPVRHYRIVTSQLGEKAGLFGAAALVFHSLQE